jgi:hypothetical protein
LVYVSGFITSIGGFWFLPSGTRIGIDFFYCPVAPFGNTWRVCEIS